ncbi:MAG: hypothetical protein WAN65_23565 [Candidatus Sulfotelmatobacter sp.]
MTKYTDILFDGPPGHEAGRFVEVEDGAGRSINIGEWIERDDGLWALRLTESDTRLVPVFAENSKTPMLFDIYVLVSGQPTWIGSRRTVEQCTLAIKNYVSASSQ